MCIAFVIFGGKGAEGEEVVASRFPAIVCDGESQLYIFGIGGAISAPAMRTASVRCRNSSKGWFMFMMVVVSVCFNL